MDQDIEHMTSLKRFCVIPGVRQLNAMLETGHGYTASLCAVRCLKNPECKSFSHYIEQSINTCELIVGIPSIPIILTAVDNSYQYFATFDCSAITATAKANVNTWG